MISTKDALKQTCKTILFEKFSDDAQDLKTILDLYDDPTLIGKDELEKLEVHSFEEFMVKFKPKIYESCQLVGGLPAFTYTCDADEAKSRNAIEKDIEDNVFDDVKIFPDLKLPGVDEDTFVDIDGKNYVKSDK